MTLDKDHREALITELNKAKEEFNLAYQIDFKNTTEDFQKWSEIKKFLLSKRIELIESSLISNEIDF